MHGCCDRCHALTLTTRHACGFDLCAACPIEAGASCSVFCHDYRLVKDRPWPLACIRCGATLTSQDIRSDEATP
jgi:hypothetical protein